MNSAVFGNTIGNMRKYKGMKLVTTGYEGDYLVSEPNYHITNVFSEDLLTTELKKTRKYLWMNLFI